jgi:hypothetical protein
VTPDADQPGQCAKRRPARSCARSPRPPAYSLPPGSSSPASGSGSTIATAAACLRAHAMCQPRPCQVTTGSKPGDHRFVRSPPPPRGRTHRFSRNSCQRVEADRL